MRTAQERSDAARAGGEAWLAKYGRAAYAKLGREYGHLSASSRRLPVAARKPGLIPGEGDGSDIRSSNAVPVPLAVESSISSGRARGAAQTSSAGAIGRPRRAKTR